MSTAPLALALVFMATMFTLLLSDYARFEQEIVRLEARAARVAARLVTCELEDVADPRGECGSALSELGRDHRMVACLEGPELRVTLTGDWAPELWAGLNPVEVTAARRFEGWGALSMGSLLSACSLQSAP